MRLELIEVTSIYGLSDKLIWALAGIACWVTCAAAKYFVFRFLKSYFSPFQLKTPPVFQANHIPKGKVVYWYNEIRLQSTWKGNCKLVSG